jgi:GTP pyrophosphokinase
LTLSKCCRPIRGDAIIGFLQRKQGLVIHTADCPVARKQRAADNLRWIDLEWDKKAELENTFPASVAITASNEKGLLAKIASQISEAGANIADVSLETVLDDVRINIVLDVNDRVHLAQVFKSVRTLGQVKKIARRFVAPRQ